MSKKSFFGNLKKPKEPEAPPPRPTKEIREEHFRTCAEAGEVGFKIKSLEIQQMQLNQRIAQLHQEYTAAERIEAEAKPVEVPKEELKV